MTTTRSTERPGRSHQRLLAAATEELSARGLDDVTLDDIARRAGVHRVTLHRTFPGGRDELVLAVVHRAAVSLTTACCDAVAAAPDATTGAVEAIATAIEVVRANRALTALVSRHSTRVALHTPAAAAISGVLERVWHAVRERAAEEGITPSSRSDADTVDFVLRIGLSLLVEPGRFADPGELRSYLRTFAAPALLRS